MGLKVIIFGASGMVGRGVLLECMEHDQVEKVTMVNRYSIGVEHEKLTEVIHTDFLNYDAIKDQLKGFDACFWTLGISAVGLSEEKYTEISYEYTHEAAKVLKELNPAMSFTYVSGVGTDSTENGRLMWARVKGRTENKLISMFDKAYMYRPGYIQPLKGVKSKTALYNAMYVVFSWLYPVFKAIGPNSVTTTVQIGKAMIESAQNGYDKTIIDPVDINLLARKLG